MSNNPSSNLTCKCPMFCCRKSFPRYIEYICIYMEYLQILIKFFLFFQIPLIYIQVSNKKHPIGRRKVTIAEEMFFKEFLLYPRNSSLRRSLHAHPGKNGYNSPALLTPHYLLIVPLYGVCINSPQSLMF